MIQGGGVVGRKMYGEVENMDVEPLRHHQCNRITSAEPTSGELPGSMVDIEGSCSPIGGSSNFK